MKNPKKHQGSVSSSMKSAAGITGLSYRAIQAAKDGGCLAIKQNGRVNIDELTEWLSQHPEVLERAGEAVSYDLELALKCQQSKRLSIPFTCVPPALSACLFPKPKRD